MLDILRKKKEHWVSALIVLAVAIVMAFFGVSKFADDKANPNKPVAWVNGEAIAQRDFSRELDFTLNQYRNVLGEKYNESLIKAFRVPQRTLERMVQYTLLTQQADKMGFFISDQELSDHIKSLPYFQKDGKFDATLYARIPNPGLEERRQRQQMGATRLQNYVTGRIKLLPVDAQNSQILKRTQVELQYAAIDFNALASKATPSQTILDEVSKNDSLIKTRYETKKAEYTEPARYRFKQIRVGVPFQASEDTKKQARDKINQIKSTVTSDNFSTTAKSQSDDEYAQKGGERGWVKEGSLDKTLETALAQLAPAQISPVVETPAGLFIVQLLEKEPSTLKPLESVKSQIVKDLASEQAKNQLIDKLKKEWEEALTQGKNIEADLQKMGLSLKKTGKFTLDKETIPDIGNAESLIEGIYELTPGAPIPKRLYFFQDKYYYVKLISASALKEEPLKKEDEDVLINSLQADLFKNWISTLEKQASIKLDKEFEDKPNQKTTSL